MAEIEELTSFDKLYNDVNVAVGNRHIFLKELSTRMSKMLIVMDKIQKDSLIESIHNNLKAVVAGSTNDVGEVEKRFRNLEDREKQLVVEFNKVMANLYLLPGYVLAVSTGVSGLLSSDPRICGLFVCVILVVLSFLAALGLAVRFALRQLGPLLTKQDTLASERRRLYQDFKNGAGACIGISLGTDGASAVGASPAAPSAGGDAPEKKLKSYEKVHEELKFQADYYKVFLWLIILCGLLYALMLSIAGYCVLCDCKAISFNTISDQWLWLLTPYL